jgi:hypothetical protein
MAIVINASAMQVVVSSRRIFHVVGESQAQHQTRVDANLQHLRRGSQQMRRIRTIHYISYTQKFHMFLFI